MNYDFVLGFRGGTYIIQASARTDCDGHPDAWHHFFYDCNRVDTLIVKTSREEEPTTSQ